MRPHPNPLPEGEGTSTAFSPSLPGEGTVTSLLRLLEGEGIYASPRVAAARADIATRAPYLNRLALRGSNIAELR